ncbi:hypothetical protein ABIF50_009561 [Bradyrhizobium diazoefficiens]
MSRMVSRVTTSRGARAVGGELAAAQHDQPVGEADRQVEIVQDRDHGGAGASAAARGLDEVDLVAQIKARGWLVQQQKPRSMLGLAAGELHQHAGEMGALLLAARQRRQLPFAEMRQPHLVQRGIDEPACLARAAVACAHQHDLLDGEGEGDVDVLGQHRASRGKLARRVAADVALLQPYLALARTEVAGEQPQQGRLAGAVRADDGDHLAGRNREADAIQQLRAAGALA